MYDHVPVTARLHPLPCVVLLLGKAERERMPLPRRLLLLLQCLLVLADMLPTCTPFNSPIVSVMTKVEQQRLLNEKHRWCLYKMALSKNQTRADPDRKMCEVTWDDVLCWDETPAGTLARQPCPDYVNGLNKHEFATKLCTVNGTWYFNKLNKTWTNFTDCIKPPEDLDFHNEVGERLRLIYTVGYSFSLFSLIIAIIIMLCSRRLHSKSNTLHINLFIAFILRASVSFLKDLLFVRNLGLEKDVAYKKDGTLKFLNNGPHWECKMLFSLFNYTILASSMWILMEGLYLHNLIYRTLRTERNGVRYYIIAGWSLPLVFLIPWMTVKATLENLFCWNLPAHTPYYWILKGPVIAIVVTNFFFFLDIFRVLFLRARMNRRHIGNAKYRKLAKFILVLIPLFGVMYIVLYVAFPSGFNQQDFNPIYLYIEMTYNSFQGFILAVLFCFLNEEVHTELRRMYQRHKSRRGDSMALTRSFAMQSGRRGSASRMQPGFRSRSWNKTPPLRQCSSSSQDFRAECSDELRRKVLTNSARFQVQPRPGSESDSQAGDIIDRSGKDIKGGRGILLKILRKRRRKAKNRQSKGEAGTDDQGNGHRVNGKVKKERGRREEMEGEEGVAQAGTNTTNARLEYPDDQDDDCFHSFPNMDSIDSNDAVVVWGKDSEKKAEKEHHKSNETDRNDNEKETALSDEERQIHAEKPKKAGRSNLTVRFLYHENQSPSTEERRRHAPSLKYLERQATVESEDSLEYVDLSSDEMMSPISPLNGSTSVCQNSH